MQPRWQPSLDDYVDMAAYLLRTDRAAIIRLPRLALAESALHAPFASFADDSCECRFNDAIVQGDAS